MTHNTDTLPKFVILLNKPKLNYHSKKASKKFFKKFR